jgi:xanthine dehydrogenase accessory factor
MALKIVLRGGGDLASGVAFRLAKVGIRVLITELEQPLAVRRTVSFAQAIYSQEIEIEGLHARRITTPVEIEECWEQGVIPVLADPECQILRQSSPAVLVDARMMKRAPELTYPAEWMTVGLGPGFLVGENCDAAIETQRGFYLGRVYWHGSPEPDTQIPDAVDNRLSERVLRAPQTGFFEGLVNIGDLVPEGALLGRVGDQVIVAQFAGIVRGLLQTGVFVPRGTKIGDLDPRQDPRLCYLFSDKALAVGGGVLEAILSVKHLREGLCRPR